ncbi:hypothetical protein PanWU01x14_197260 [Parasponia andersonii]|uniref:Uncharacterized protein n=1 Tax=Parasponia andersonii TaxID=3476 RepID=A0A2P5BZE7_PARAD|nr:hypothetical protein PanWU01x14_197260 [Parasponia andersonii]
MVMCRSACSFHTPVATKIEIKFPWMSDHCIHHSPWQNIFIRNLIVCERRVDFEGKQSCVVPFLNYCKSYGGFRIRISRRTSCLDVLQLFLKHFVELGFAYSVSKENDSLRKFTNCLLEIIQQFSYHGTKILDDFLSVFLGPHS